MKRGLEKKHSDTILNRKVIITVVIIALILSLSFTLYTFFSTGSCDTMTCFNKALAKCNKVKFVNMQEEATWVYTIKGPKKDECVVHVKSTNVNLYDAKRIENKEMLCYIPKGIVIPPESVLDNCHGLLKEELQNIIIEKLHVYIVQNIGKISEGITEPL